MNSLLLREASAALVALVVLVCAALPACAADRKIERRVPPIYPELARRMHIAGTVRVEVTIAPNGKVTQAKAVSGNGILEPAAEQAIRKWKFAPDPTPSTEDVEINFQLTD